MENKVCKKCHKPLPEGYKHKKCEACRNVQVQSIKKAAKNVVGVVASVVLVAATKGKHNYKE